MATFPINKLLLIALLGAVALFLGTIVVTLQIFVLHDKKLQMAKSKPFNLSTLSRRRSGDKQDKKRPRMQYETINPSIPLREEELYLWKQYGNFPNDPSTAARAYWNLAQPAIEKWDAALKGDHDDSYFSNRPINDTHALLSLQEASKWGNSEAQFHVANALSSGIWPIDDGNDEPSATALRVPQDMMPYQNNDDGDESKEEDDQIIQAQLLYRMAAIDGHVDSSVALGYRYLQYSESSSDGQNCKAALPFYEAAANGVMDQLEASHQHRGKIQPPMDKHVLAQVHLHGGTSSQLHFHNKPDESPEALQYYHLRATKPSDPDLNAAYTLGHLYHYGIRGVSQNMTLALKYYEIAANHRHGEAAGQAGKFYFWALGMEYDDRDLAKAHRYFRVGAPWGLDGCTDRWKRSKKKKKDGEGEDVRICDHPSVNGMGLLHLYGIPHLLPVDYEKARKFFKLAKQMGNMDAMYNLAMMNLGWKEHFVDISEDDEEEDDHGDKDGAGNPITKVDPLKKGGYQKPYKGPSKVNYQHAVNDLMTAANMGHVQARHRLGLMYSKGVLLKNLDGNNKDHWAVVQDCGRAMTHFKYVIDTASLSLSHRARHAYKQYMAGNYEESLRNYMAAAETGNEIAQVNAAFLLERGVCLNLSPLDCARASVRLWKAAAQQGNAEACLRVGDFYYYGRLRQEEESKDEETEQNFLLPTSASLLSPVMGPFWWMHYAVFPERLIPHLQKALSRTVHYVESRMLERLVESKEESEGSSSSLDSAPAPVCDESKQQEDGTCPVGADEEAPQEENKSKDRITRDLAMAAHYYRMAAEEHKSPRANFNLGFMHEWGLGLSQDFPLAKRHYDLASPPNSQIREAEVPVQIALVFLSWHETVVKLSAAWEEWWNSDQEERQESASDKTSTRQRMKQQEESRDAVDVILSHLVSWESVLIVVLTVVLSILVRHRRTRPR